MLTVDNSKQFGSQPFREFCQSIGTKLMFASVYHPQSVDTVFLTRVKEGDFYEEKVADLEETKRCTVLESADRVHLMD